MCKFRNNPKPLQRLVEIFPPFSSLWGHLILKRAENETNSTQTWHIWYSRLSKPTHRMYDITETQSLAMMYGHGCLCVREIFKETNRACGISFQSGVRRKRRRHRWSRERDQSVCLLCLHVPGAFFWQTLNTHRLYQCYKFNLESQVYNSKRDSDMKCLFSSMPR